MKYAIVHDALTEFGGAEQVVKTLLKMFPGAHVFAPVADKKILSRIRTKNLASTLHLSPLQRFPFTKPSVIQLLSPLLYQSFNFDPFDIILTNSAHLLSNSIRRNNKIHIQYIHCVPKNLYSFVPQNKLQSIFPYSALLRTVYKRAITATPYILANSKYTKGILESLFPIKADVLYPPVAIPKKFKRGKRLDYFLVVSRLTQSKNIDMAIHACNTLRVPLKIVGKASDKAYETHLKSLAGPTIEFLGFIPDGKVKALYEKAKAFIINATQEDFGIAPVEAMAHGVPVITYHGGGLRETVIQNVTGVFYFENSTQSLMQTLKKFHPEGFDPQTLHTHTKKFSKERFASQLLSYIQKIRKEHPHLPQQ